MICEKCGGESATVHLTITRPLQTHDYCFSCARGEKLVSEQGPQGEELLQRLEAVQPELEVLRRRIEEELQAE